MSNFTGTNSYNPTIFTDVEEDAWYGNNNLKVIASVYEYGLMQGDGNTFNPIGNMTVAEAVTIAARVHNIYNGAGVEFDQTTPWYQAYTDYALNHGIIGASMFAASDYGRPATRAEMAYVFSRTLHEDEFIAINSVTGLPDVDENTQYSEAIFMLYRAGVLTGNNDAGTFYPVNNITRVEAAAIISRVILPTSRISKAFSS